MLDNIRLVVDLDSTVVDLCRKWFGEYNMDHDDDLTIDRIETWDTHLYVKPSCGLKIYDYLEAPGFYRDLRPIKGAIETLKWASSLFEIVIATSRPAAAHEDTIAWVDQHMQFVDIDDVVFTSRKDLIIGDILIDDCPHHLESFKGVPMVFGNYPYNCHLTQFNHAKDWAAVKTYLLQLL